MTRTAILLAALAVTPAVAETRLDLPAGAIETAREFRDQDQHHIAIGPFDRTHQPTRKTKGTISDIAYRLPIGTITPLSLIDLLKPQLRAANYRIVYECQDADCGGFDFRFNIDVLPPPGMEVTLSDFTYLAAVPTDGRRAQISLLSSQTARGTFLQISEVTQSEVPAPPPAREGAPEITRSASENQVTGTLLREGRTVLEDVTFESGARDISPAAIASLAPIAEFLLSNPDAAILIVGHTDNVGSRDDNIRVSRARAQVVRQALISDYEIDPGRITADGVGFLAPRTSNATEEGRARNRRVEVVLR